MTFTPQTRSALTSVLTLAGGLLAAKGLLPSEKVGPLVDGLITAIGALVAVGSILYDLYVASVTQKRITAVQDATPGVQPTGKLTESDTAKIVKEVSK